MRILFLIVLAAMLTGCQCRWGAYEGKGKSFMFKSIAVEKYGYAEDKVFPWKENNK